MSRWSRDVRLAMKGRTNFHLRFSASQAAASLWDHGEDLLADRALTMTEADLAAIQRIAATYWDPGYALPIEGQRLTLGKVSAFAAIAYFEGRLRPLSRTRRRPKNARPARFAPLPLDPGTGIERA